MAEHCAMLSMIFSPRNSGSRMIKRLAEINLVNGDDEAALKYLRILDKTLLHKSWAEKRIPGQQTPASKGVAGEETQRHPDPRPTTFR